MIRKILAVLIGVVAGSVFNMAVITLSHAMYPLPKGIAPDDFDAFRAHFEANGMPIGAMLMVLLAHAGGSFVSGILCGVIAKRSWYGAAVALGLLWMCGGITMLIMLPSPTWFALADLVLYLPAALLGVRLGGALAGSNSPPVAIQ